MSTAFCVGSSHAAETHKPHGAERRRWALAVVLTLLSATGCKAPSVSQTVDAQVAKPGETMLGQPLASASTGTFTPVPLPDPHIAGFHMPEDPTVINGWVSANNLTAMSAHEWGIWAALTATSGQSFEGQNLAV